MEVKEGGKWFFTAHKLRSRKPRDRVKYGIGFFRMETNFMKIRNGKYLALFLIGMVLSLIFAVFESRQYWGYWIARPSLSSALESIDRADGLSMLRNDYPSFYYSLEAEERQKKIKQYPPYFLNSAQIKMVVANSPNFCNGGDEYYCLDGGLFRVLNEQNFNLEENVKPVDNQLLASANEKLGSKYSTILNSGARTQPSSVWSRMTAIRFVKEGEERLLLAIRWPESSNDHYKYEEALFSVKGEDALLEKKISFYFDIAGIEGLEWYWLWGLNFLAFLFLVGTCNCLLLLRKLASFNHQSLN